MRVGDSYFQPDGLWEGIDTLYNEGSYDDSGWCTSENNISCELTVRLSAATKIATQLDQLPPKMYAISSTSEPTPIQRGTDTSSEHVEEALDRIEKSKFTGKGDKEMVKNLYRDYVMRLSTILSKGLNIGMKAVDSTERQSLPPMPSIAGVDGVPFFFYPMSFPNRDVTDGQTGQAKKAELCRKKRRRTL